MNTTGATMTRAHRRVPRRGAPRPAPFLAAGAALLTGCTSNPFAPHPSDTHALAGPERLRQVGTLQLTRIEPDPARPDPTPDEQVAQARARREAVERVSLSLNDARVQAFTNNLGLRATLISPTIAAERVGEEEGRFNAVFTLDANWAEIDDAVATELADAQSTRQSITPGVTIPLRTGGELTISAPVSRIETNNSFSLLNPAVTADLQVSLSHNLLRGAGRRVATHAIRLAEYDRQISEAQTKLEVIRTLADVDRAYWRLYAAVRALEVVEQQYAVAREQLERAERRLNAGSGAEIDVIRARSGVADRVEQIILAQNEIRLRERDLKARLNAPGLPVGGGASVEPVTDPDPVRYVFDEASLAEAAVNNRMELLELELQLARDAAQVAFNQNQTLPLLALQYTYRVNGLGGTFRDAAEQTIENDFEDWTVGLRAEVPLGNEQRRASLAQSILARLQRLATREARRQQIEKEVFDAVDQLASTWQRILASRQAVLLNARALEAERRQFEVGRSTSTDVLDADASLANARLAEIRAIVEYEIARVDLAVATGTLLGQARVDWAPRDPREETTTDEQIPVRYRPGSGIFRSP